MIFTIEVDQAAPPLKPGESGMKTNGPVAFWYRINSGEWQPVNRTWRSWFKLRTALTTLMDGGA